MTGFATVVFSKWEHVATEAACVVVGAVLATGIIGRALRWKAGMRELEKKRRDG
jgi:hypothetical protein